MKSSTSGYLRLWASGASPPPVRLKSFTSLINWYKISGLTRQKHMAYSSFLASPDKNNYQLSSKRFVGLDPNGWIQWIMDNKTIEIIGLLSPKFRSISQEGDVLVEVSSPEDGDFLVFSDVQWQCDRRSPIRIRAYIALAEAKYRLPVYPILINILPPAPGLTIPTRYSSSFMGLHAFQDYQVINMWEVSAEVAFGTSLTALLALTPIMKGGDDFSVVRRAAEILQKDDQLIEWENLLGLLASHVFDLSLVQKLVRFDMTELQESSLILMFQQQVAVRMLTNQLQKRFGKVPESVIIRMQVLSLPELEELGLVFAEVNSLDGFIASIPLAHYAS